MSSIIKNIPSSSSKKDYENEVELIMERYRKRDNIPSKWYDPLTPAMYMTRQEKERALIKWIKYADLSPVKDKSVLEIGCGSGNNLLLLQCLGFSPENLTGNELLKERAEEAQKKLSSRINIIQKNALNLELKSSSFDIVFQSMVFSSILNDRFKDELAKKMWDWAKPGGGILWYDFIYNNPRNKDVVGIPSKKVKEYFPDGKFVQWKITLAPPISRRVTVAGSVFYSIFNVLPVLRTHILCWIKKS